MEKLLDVQIDGITIKIWIFLWCLFFFILWYANKRMNDEWGKTDDYETQLDKEERDLLDKEKT